MTVTGLDHVQVTAPPGAESEARRFYTGLLGLAEMDMPPGVAATGGAWFRFGSQELHVGIDRDFAPARKGHPGLDVVDVPALERLALVLTEAGVEIEWDERLPDVRRFYTSDPWGNRLELRTPAG